MKVEEIEKDVNNPQSYINPFKAREYLLFLLSRIRTLKEGIRELIAYGMPTHIEEGLQKLLEE